MRFIQRAVKPLPLGGGYKAHLNWNFLPLIGRSLRFDILPQDRDRRASTTSGKITWRSE